jgi:hypothetical protein
MLVKRLVYTKFYKFVFAYSIENITIKFDEREMDMKTKFIKKSSLFPPVNGDGVE